MADTPLPRRQVLRLGVGSTLLATAGLLGACREASPRLMAARASLPAAWLSGLPRPWRLEPQLEDNPASVCRALLGPADARPALAQLSDGWVSSLPVSALQSIGTAALFARFDPQIAQLDALFAAGAPARPVFPVSVSPWVILLRSRPDLQRRRSEGWNLLLDPGLRGQLVLPSSARVCIALVQGDPARLRTLRAQALAHDDRDAISLLLAGDAQAAVVPRQRVVPLLRRDPRLAVILPSQGAPLSWTLLVNAAGAPEAPLTWLAELLEPGLLRRLLPAGWVPPAQRQVLQQALAGVPAELRELLLPPQEVLARCFTLAPLGTGERQRLQDLWDAAAPAV